MDEEETPNIWYGVALGIFPTALLLIFILLPTVKADDDQQWQVDHIWELILGLPLSLAIGGLVGICAAIFGFMIGGLIELVANRNRSWNNRVDSEDIAAIVAIASGVGMSIAAFALVIKSFTIFY